MARNDGNRSRGTSPRNPWIPTAEQLDLDKKQTELDELKQRLADEELGLANLRAELGLFERKYIETAAVRYAELDELAARLAERSAAEHPDDAVERQKAQSARVGAAKSSAVSQSGTGPVKLRVSEAVWARSG